MTWLVSSCLVGIVSNHTSATTTTTAAAASIIHGFLNFTQGDGSIFLFSCTWDGADFVCEVRLDFFLRWRECFFLLKEISKL